jgi:cytidine deaminase
VGAAVLLEDGTVIKGSNQENASYPLGLCAERVAIFHASSAYPGQKIMAIAITASAQHFVTQSPITPCGACRQTIAEYEFKQDKNIEIFFTGETGIIVQAGSLNDLLPLAFDNTLL